MSDAISNTQVVSEVQATPLVKDEFGRDSAERIVELSPRCAEQVGREVDEGEHATFDDALAYIINAGVVAIANRRKQAAELKTARELRVKQAMYALELKRNPELALKPDYVARMMKELNIISEAQPTKKG